MTTLSEMAIGLEAVFLKHADESLLKDRLADLGFTPGAKVKVIRHGPKENLVAVDIRSTVIAIRKLEAGRILVNMIP